MPQGSTIGTMSIAAAWSYVNLLFWMKNPPDFLHSWIRAWAYLNQCPTTAVTHARSRRVSVCSTKRTSIYHSVILIKFLTRSQNITSVHLLAWDHIQNPIRSHLELPTWHTESFVSCCPQKGGTPPRRMTATQKKKITQTTMKEMNGGQGHGRPQVLAPASEHTIRIYSRCSVLWPSYNIVWPGMEAICMITVFL